MAEQISQISGTNFIKKELSCRIETDIMIHIEK